MEVRTARSRAMIGNVLVFFIWRSHAEATPNLPLDTTKTRGDVTGDASGDAFGIPRLTLSTSF